MSDRYAIVDIETTGLSAGQGRITEIAILVYDGQNVVNEFVTLVNPEIPIPYFITRLTGINNQMVAAAPRFFEVARQVVEITEDCTIVGHNVRFDYSFLRAEFKSLGYNYQRKTLDTVGLARKLMPGLPGYSLDKICKALQINNKSRHRAAGDASATLELFRRLLSLNPNIIYSTKTNIQTGKHLLVDNLPEMPGVYQFFDAEGKLIYVGKSINIRARVMQHLNSSETRKALELRNTIESVKFELTGNELIALLLESDLIKKHQPLYNRRQRRALYNYGLYHFLDENGYLCLNVAKTVEELLPDYSYSSLLQAREHLFQLTEQYQLCQKLNRLYSSAGPCFHHQIGQCFGACSGIERPNEYNERAFAAVNRFHFEHDSFFIVLKGRSEEEIGIMRVAKGVYRGFGFVPVAEFRPLASVMDEYIIRYADNRDVRQIVKSYLRNSKDYTLMPDCELKD
jgi:DNA polymerase-3 subunit epsilon